jgi:hypothetical protein
MIGRSADECAAPPQINSNNPRAIGIHPRGE